MSSNGSIALWCVPRTGSVPTQIEGHFNYWRLSGDKSYRRRRAARSAVKDFVEIGIFIVDIQQIDSICIYVPAPIERDMVEDCSPYLAKADFAQGIFNEVITITAPAPGGPQCVVLHDQTNAVFTRVHCFAQGSSGLDSSELAIALQHGGTVLTVLPAAVQGACAHTAPAAPTYFRLRVYLDDTPIRNPFVKVIQPLDQWFQSGYDEIEYIDFRMNEARTLPLAIEQRMRADRTKGGSIDFRLVAFLTAVPVYSELSVSNTPSHKMRLLEPIWNHYVDSGIPEGMVVYHWKKLPQAATPITDFSAFVKLQTRRTSRKILLTYLAIAFATGLIGNWTAEIISDRVKSAWASPPAVDQSPHVGAEQGRRGAAPPPPAPKRLPAPSPASTVSLPNTSTSPSPAAAGGAASNAVGNRL